MSTLQRHYGRTHFIVLTFFYCHFLTGVKTPPLFCFQQRIGSSFMYNAFWKCYGLLTKDVTSFEQSGHESVFYLYFSKTARKTSF